MKPLFGLLIFCIPFLSAQQRAVEFTCPDGQTFHVEFREKAKAPRGARGESAVLSMEGKPRLALPHAVSASGSRYSDGYTTLWIKGNQAMIQSGSVNVKDCTSSNAATSGPSLKADLLEGSWQLVSLGGRSVDLARLPEMKLEPGSNRMTGFGGCNRIAGGFERNGSKLKFTQTVSTRMECFGPNMQVEGRLLKALENTTSFRVDEAELVLTGSGGVALATFKKQ